jgi:topoisomerase-4 subunit A
LIAKETGEYLTGDGAAASRYIEARLSKFALEVLYSPKIRLGFRTMVVVQTNNLPVKFPLLAQGAEGIAVGLSTKVLPHNFNELLMLP